MGRIKVILLPSSKTELNQARNPSWCPPDSFEVLPVTVAEITDDDWFLFMYEGEYFKGNIDALHTWANVGTFDAVSFFIERTDNGPKKYDEEFRFFKGSVQLDADLNPVGYVARERCLDGLIGRRASDDSVS